MTTETPTAETPSADPAFGFVPVELIDVPDDHEMRADDLEGLKASILSAGILDPLLLRQTGERFELIDGGRRLQVARMAELTTVPAQVRNADTTTRRVFRTIKNIQREQFHPLQEAREFRLLAEEDGLSPTDIARRVGRSPLHVQQRLSLLRLPESYQKLIHSQEPGSLTLGDALELVRLSDYPADLDLAYNAIRGGLEAGKAVQAQLTKRAGEFQRSEIRKEIEQRGDIVFQGKVGADGWVVTRDEPAPGYLYWPEDREPHTSFQYLPVEDGEQAICVNPLLFLQDPDPQVVASAQALAGLAQGDTAEQPATPLTPDEAQKARDAAERKHFKGMRKADEVREQFLTKLVRGRVTSDYYDLIFQALVDVLTPAQRDLIYARCNVARVERAEGFGETWDVAGYLERPTGSWAKLGYAAALQIREDGVDALVKAKTRLAHGAPADTAARYLEHLESRGYALTTGERELAGLEVDAGGQEAAGEGSDEPEAG